MALTNKDLDVLFEEFKLDKTFEDLQYGGVLTALTLLFRVPRGPEQEQKLKDVFGKDWAQWFTQKHYNDEGIDEDRMPAESKEVVTTTEPDGEGGTTTTSTTRYWFYMLKSEAFSKMNNEELLEFSQVALGLYSTSRTPCRGDQIFIIIVLFIIIIVTAGSTASAAVKFASIMSSMIQIGLTMGVFGTGQRAENMQYLAMVLSLYSGVVGWSEMTTLAQFNTAVQIAGTAVQGVDTYKSRQMQDKIDAVLKETEEIQDETAEMFEAAMEFVYHDSYEFYIRDSEERHPHGFIHEQYADFSTYPRIPTRKREE